MADKPAYAPVPYGIGLDTTRYVPGSYVRDNMHVIDDVMPPARPAPTAQAPVAAVAYSPSLKKFFVNGNTFDDGDDTSAAASLKYFDPNKPQALPAGDWVPLSPAGYAAYVGKIVDPSMGKLAKKNFGIGVDSLKGLAGAGLKFLGAEQTGQSVIDSANESLGKTDVYQRNATDIGSDPHHGILDWFVANLAQQGPNIVESALTTAAGAVAGGVAGAETGPGALGTAAGGAIAAMVGRAAFKQGLISAAKKYAEGKVLEAGERKLLLEAAGLTAAAQETAMSAGGEAALKNGLALGVKNTSRSAGKYLGATAATGLNNEAIGVSDIYGEQLDPGQEPSRAYAAIGSIPYAAMESLPEYLLAARLLGGFAHGTGSAIDQGIRGKAISLLGRGIKGGAFGAVTEGGVEAGQEALLMAAHHTVDWNSPQSVARIYNAFAAGAGVGGPIGSLAHLAGGHEAANVLDIHGTAEPTPEQLALPNPGEQLALPAPSPENRPPVPGGGTPGSAGEMLKAIGARSGQGIASLGGNLDAAASLQPGSSSAVAVDASGNASLPQGLSAPATGSLPPGAAPTVSLAPPVLNAPPTTTRSRILRRGEAAMQAGTQATVNPSEPPVPSVASPQGAAAPIPGNYDFLVPGEVAPQATSQVQAPAQTAAPIPSAGSPPIDLSQHVAAAMAPTPETAVSPPVTKGAALKKGTRLPVKVISEHSLLARDYGAVADKIKLANPGDTERIALAERLATLSDANLKKLKSVWNPSFEPDQTQDPAKVMAVIDRTLGVKPKAASLKKGVQQQAQKETVTSPVTDTQTLEPTLGTTPSASQSPVQAQVEAAAPPTPDAASTIPALPLLPKGQSLKRPKPTPKPSSVIKNVVGEAAPVKTASPQVSGTTADLNDAIDTWNDPKDTEDRTQAAQYVTSLAFAGDSNERARGEVAKALATLDHMLLDATREVGDAAASLDRALIAESANPEVLKNNEFRSFVAKRGLTTRIFGSDPEASKTQSASSDTERLTSVIHTMLTDKVAMQDTAMRTRLTNDAKVIFNGIRKAGLDPFIYGVKASKFFQNNRLNINYDTETKTYRLAVGIDPARDILKNDAPSGMFKRAEDGKDTKSYAPGEVRMLATKFMSKFKMKPTIAVFRNVAEMKVANPDLFKRAAAARANGDFETTRAAGYSFGTHVVVFSDYIRTEHQLGVLLAHESLGHFGMRAIMDEKTLKAGLDAAYDQDSRLKAAIDREVSLGMDKHEAIEEYIADYAAVIDNSMLANIWNMIKNALNKIGIKFDDDHARLMVNQVRRYMKDPRGSFFSATSFYDKMVQMDANHAEGRYSKDPLQGEKFASSFFQTNALSKMAMNMRGITGLVNFMHDYGATKTFGVTKGRIGDMLDSVIGAVESLDFRASKSAGLGEVYKLFEAQHNLSRQLLSQFQDLTSFSHKANWWAANKDAPTETDKQNAGELLAYAAIYKMQSVDIKLMDSYGELVKTDKEGNVTPNWKTIRQMEKDGFVTAEEFRKGLKFKDALGVEHIYPAREIDENSKEWRIYKEQRAAVNAAAVAVLLANYNALTHQNIMLHDSAAHMYGTNKQQFSEADLKTLQEVSKKFYELYLRDMKIEGARANLDMKNKDLAERFIKEVVRVMDPTNGDKKLQDWVNGKTDEDAIHFQGDEYKTIRDGLASLNKVKLSDRNRNLLAQVLQNGAIAKVDAVNADYHAKRTILSSYAPLKRSGKFQVRLVAVGPNGKPVVLSDEYQGIMPYYREDERTKIVAISDNLDRLFEGKKYVVKDAAGEQVTVSFRAEHGLARQTPDMGDIMDYADFVHVLDRQNISLTPAERQRLVEGLTRQGSMARDNLQRTGNPGWRANMLQSVSEHLETMAHVAAKRTFKNRMDVIVGDDNMWRGDERRLGNLKAAANEKGLSPETKAYRMREYNTYAAQFAEMADTYSGGQVEVNGKMVPLRGQGEKYREEANKLLRWQTEALGISDSTEDILSTALGSKLKNVTVLAQLGMSVATAAVNLGSLVTHSTTYMAFYNPKNGFGMGFGYAKSAAAIASALSDLKNHNFSNTDFLKKIVGDGSHTKYGLTKEEAAYLLDQTMNGTYQAAQFNALIGSARGRVNSNRINDVIQKWMYMFSYTEQLNRRVTGLAAYRMEYQRGIAEGGLTEAQARAAAEAAAHKAVVTSQGEYSMFNRPELARGNFGQYIFMYKMFTAISVQMLRSLPPAGRITFLATLMAAAGVKGLPFAEDIMDLIDTLCQMFGIKVTSVEKEAYALFDSMAPGYAPYFMRGVIDQFTGSTVSSKVGMGDIIPLSGALKYGADPWNETKQFIGPVFGATLGMGNWAFMLANYGAGAVGIRPDTTSFNDVLRNSPLAVMKSLGDSIAYMESGAITNIRGQVVSKDAGMGTVIARLLGFYPAESTRQNDIIRLSKQSANYAKAIKSELVNAYTQAAINKDSARMQHIAKQVEEWNANAKGTGLEVNNFMQDARKSVTEASRSALARYSKIAPKQQQDFLKTLTTLQGADPGN